MANSVKLDVPPVYCWVSTPEPLSAEGWRALGELQEAVDRVAAMLRADPSTVEVELHG